MIFDPSPHPVVYLAVLAAIFAYLYWSFRHDHFLLWAGGWTLLLARQVVSSGPPGPGSMAWLDAGVVLLAAAAIVAGGVAFAGRARMGALGGLTFGVALGILTVLIYLAVGTVHPAPLQPWAAAISFLAAGWIGAGWLIDRYGGPVAPIGRRVAGLALALWGVVQAAGWVLVARGVGGAWLSQVDAALGSALAIGMVILGMEEERTRSSGSQTARHELLDDDPNMIVVLQEGRFAFVNRAMVRRLGYSPEDMRKMGLMDRVAPEHRDQAVQRLTERRQGRPVPDYELDLVTRDGTRVPVIVHADPIEWEGEPALKYELTDISSRKRAEEEVQAMNVELQRINQELEKSSRLKSEFLSNTSHELKTPLTSIIANTEILEYEMCGPVNEEQKQILSSISRNSQHLLEMISRLLDFARYEEGGDVLRSEPVEPRTLIEGVVRTVTPLLEGRPIRLEVDADVGDGPCLLDGEKIYRIYLNLVENAVKFSDSGTIRIGARRVGDEIEGSVIDEGIGIPPHQRVEIFEAFRQGDSSPTRSYQGVGLGLSICKQLVELHRGRIWAEENPSGKGSTFRFRVPCGPPEAPGGRPPA